ncbi:hypothetical protein JCM19992_08320 [Thermostilla marina]
MALSFWESRGPPRAAPIVGSDRPDSAVFRFGWRGQEGPNETPGRGIRCPPSIKDDSIGVTQSETTDTQTRCAVSGRGVSFHERRLTA